MMCYHIVFFAQGTVNQIWLDKLDQHSDYLRETAFYPFFVVGSIMVYGMNLPGNYTDVGFMFFYPIYGSTVMQSLFTTGTWQIIYGLCWLLNKECNRTFNDQVFEFFSNGSLFVYLCHDFWITIIATFIIYPNIPANTADGKGLSFGVCLALMLIGVEFLSNLNYYLFTKLYQCCFKKSKKAENSVSKYQNIKMNIQDQEEGGEQDKTQHQEEIDNRSHNLNDTYEM